MNERIFKAKKLLLQKKEFQINVPMDIFIGGIPPRMRQRELQEIFEKYGKVSSVNIITDYVTRLNKGYAFVKMPDRAQALSAISALNGAEIDGRKLIVNESKFRKGEGKAPDPAHRQESGRVPKEKSTHRGETGRTRNHKENRK